MNLDHIGAYVLAYARVSIKHADRYAKCPKSRVVRVYGRSAEKNTASVEVFERGKWKRREIPLNWITFGECSMELHLHC